MRLGLGVVLGCFTLVVGLLTVVAAASLPAAADEYAREPEDLWLLLFWLGVLMFLLVAGALALIRLARRPNAPLAWPGTTVAVVVASIGIVLAVLGFQDPLERGWAPAAGMVIAGLAGLFAVVERRGAPRDRDRAV